MRAADTGQLEHRAALEAGASPEIVTAWINETQVNALGELMTVLREADPADKAEVYQQLGLSLTYDPAAKRVKAEARPESIVYVGTCPRGVYTQIPMCAGR